MEIENFTNNKKCRFRKIGYKGLLFILLLVLSANTSIFAASGDDNLFLITDSKCDGSIDIKLERYNGGNLCPDDGDVYLYFKNSAGGWTEIVHYWHWEDDGNKYNSTNGNGVFNWAGYSGGPYGWTFSWKPPAGEEALYTKEVTLMCREMDSNGDWTESEADAYKITVHPVGVSPVTGVTVTETSLTELEVKWGEPDNLAAFKAMSAVSDVGYRVWESGNSSNMKKTTALSEKFTVTPGKEYTFGVDVYYTCGGSETNSDPNQYATGSTTIPEPSMPAGFKASKDRCDETIVTEWSYSGSVDPTGFVIKTGGVETDLTPDKREFELNVGHHSSANFRIKSVAGYNAESDYTETISGATSGPPGSTLMYGWVNGNKFELDWDEADYTTKYIIKKSSSKGAEEIEIIDDTKYTDKAIESCEEYFYKIYTANNCTEEDGIIGLEGTYWAGATEIALKLRPDLSAYLAEFDASKAYFSDKVVLEWETNGELSLVDRFIIERARLDDMDYSELAIVEGQSFYEDKSATGSVMYSYRISVEADCGSEILPLTPQYLTAIGFRLPYGIVNGHIEYEDGVAVKNVEVIAEKSTGAVGKSIEFPGDAISYLSVGSDSKLEPAVGITVGAWICPKGVTATNGDIINKSAGANGYRLYQDGDDVVFTVKEKTVKAENVLTQDEWIHVAGVYDGNEVKIYINGKIPFSTKYVLRTEDIEALEALNLPEDVVLSLEGLVDQLPVPENDGLEFLSLIEGEIGAAQTEAYTPFLMPLARENETISAGVATASGTITHGGDLYIGKAFDGFIDEVQIFNIGKTSEEILRDYKRVLSSTAPNIAGYWHMDENVGLWAYDVSKTGDTFHKNDAQFNGTIDWSAEIPSKEQLGWVGITDSKGDYTIPYIPYFGMGENFSLTPRYEQHQFKPTNKTVFIGEGSNIIDGQNFTDLSSFKITGTAFYDNTVCGVEGCILTIDGEVVIKNGQPVYTNQYGEFEISMPVGEHYLGIQKQGHTFKSAKFPPGPETAKFDFQEPLTGINFIDQTTVRIVGRVVGGTREGDKDPGLGLSVNNIGAASFDFESAIECSSYHIETDTKTGEFKINLPPMKYYIKNFEVPKNPIVELYFAEFPIADFSAIRPEQSSTHTFSGPVNAVITIDRDAETVTMDIEGVEALVMIDDVEILYDGNLSRFYYEGDAYEYPLDGDITVINDELAGNDHTITETYNYRFDLIYRSVPEVRVTASDGKSEFSGESKISYEDPISHTMKEFDVKTNPFNFPVFKQESEYTLKIFAEEVYKNQDMCIGTNGCDESIKDFVPVDDAEILINNLLADEKIPEPVKMKNGVASYTFKAGEPVVLADQNFPWRSYTGHIDLKVVIDDVPYPWNAYNNPEDFNFTYPEDPVKADDKYFRGYVLGANPVEGSDFVTNGPDVVDMILRDPPGNQSYSFLEKGSSFTFEQQLSNTYELSESLALAIHLGPKFSTGIGFVTEQKTENNIKLGFEATQTWSNTTTLANTVTINEAWKTSDEPYLPGTPSDLMFGSSKNFIVAIADRLTILPTQFISDNEIPSAGKEAGGFKIALNQSLIAAPEGNATHFIYTVDHIENYLIPNLIALRNNLFINDSRYTSMIPMEDELFGSNNDDPRWGDKATTSDPVGTDIGKDFGLPDGDATKPEDMGPSYTYKPKEFINLPGGIIAPKYPDKIRDYNQQIRLWRDALERNEMEKYHSKTIKNISYDAGPTFEHSTETSITQSYTSTFEASFNPSLAFNLGFKIGGVGMVASGGISFNYTIGNVTTNTVTQTNTFGYVLHDEDEGDYFSVDVKDPQTGTGPVFVMQGGRSMCPCERATELVYYQPAKYEIKDELITKLEKMNMDDDLLYILNKSTETTSWEFWFMQVLDYPISDAAKDLIHRDAMFKVEQIKDRQFKNKLELAEAVKYMINLKLDMTLEENAEFKDDISDNLEDMDQSDMSDMSEQFVLDELGNISEIYLFSKETRTEMLKEWARYRQFIYDNSGTPSKLDNNVLGASTLRREKPEIEINTPIQINIPDDNKAYFTLIMKNLSETNEPQYYQAKILESSNPDGAVIRIDGGKVHRGYLVDEIINKTMTVEMGKPDVYEYNDLKIIFYSACERELVGLISSDMDPQAIDTVSFSVHFVPSCTDIDIVKPLDQFVVNYNDEKLVDGVRQTKVPIVLHGYDLNNPEFDKMQFQFKPLVEPQYVIQDEFFKKPESTQKPIDGDFQGLEWDLSGLPDGEYQLRAKTGCGMMASGLEKYDYSEVWTGMVDRKPPKIFGSPQPADGILSPDDDIMVTFNETIYQEKLTKLNNFDIRGILNGTDLRHDVTLRFDGDESNFVRIPDGINLSGKSFTIEFWMKNERAYQNECVISQYSDPEDAVYIGFNNTGKPVFQVGDQIFETGETSSSVLVGEWHHYAFVYDHVRKEVLFYIDATLVDMSDMAAEYSGFGDIILGKSLSGDARPFKGEIHELRIWERPRTASKLAQNMLIKLSGKETGLVAYYPFNEAYGRLGVDHVHKRNATINTHWNITPSGYAASFHAGDQGKLEMKFSDVAFNEEQNFTLEFWFKSDKGESICFLSNGRGNGDDMTIYYISPESLAKIVRVLPLVDNVEGKLSPLLNIIYGNEAVFLNTVAKQLGGDVTTKYAQQILRFAKVPPTFWSINTNEYGHIQVNNNGKQIVCEENFFDNRWHHLAVVIDRIGNSRMYVDGDLKVSEVSTEWSGFGGAKLFVGARALFNNDHFEFDQYFEGSLDDIRIWNTDLLQDQINRNKTMRLDGDELGLVAYFPFESYEELMGIPVLESISDDFITKEREIIFNQGSVLLQNTDVPNIRMKRPSSKVDFEFVSKEDMVSFTFNDPVSKVENCILDVTVKNVEDMYGNTMVSPVTWSAFVDLNQMKWDEQEINLEKRLYDPMTFTATVRNSSGKQQNFSIENLPAWLTAEPREGTLDPMTYVTVTFTINEGLNIGRYNQNINLRTDFAFDEKLLLNLRVFKDLPQSWDFEASDFEYSMNIIGRIIIDNVVSVDKYDKAAAFVNGECRGIANLKYIEEYDMYEVFLDVYSNVETGENFELRIWDASKGTEYTKVRAVGLIPAPPQFPNNYVFTANTIKGSPSMPINFEATSSVRQEIPLRNGWNWISFNLKLDDMIPLVLQLEGLEPGRGDMIKGMDQYSQFTNGWFGSLNFLNNNTMYMFKTSKKDTLFITGKPVDTEETPMMITKGWNWIGYTPQLNIEINEALGRINPNPGDLIKSQYGFAMYDKNMGWLGTLGFMAPNMGYMYKYEPGQDAPLFQELVYPKMGQFKNKPVKNDYIDKLLSSVDVHSFAYNMPIIATVDDGILSDDYTVVAYCGDQIRGIAYPSEIGIGERPHYFLMTYGNIDDEILTFKMMDADGGEYYANEILDFNTKESTGTLSEPFILTINNEQTSINNEMFSDEMVKCMAYPNPFSNEIKIVLQLPESSNVKIEIIDIRGRIVMQLFDDKMYEGRNAVQWNSSDKNGMAVDKGVYFARIITEKEQTLHKIVKIK